MGTIAEPRHTMLDGIKWAVAGSLIVGALAAFYVYADQSLFLRVLGLLVVIGIAGAIALQTEKGQAAWSFAREARTEVRKVVWPTRKETVQTTGLIMALVALVAVILWILDSILGSLMRMLLGQGA